MMKLISKILLLLTVCEYSYATTIYGVDNIDKYKHSINKPVYVQMGCFSSVHAAKNYQQYISTKTNDLVQVKPSTGKYQVQVGPFNSYAALKAFAQKFQKNTFPKASLVTVNPTPVKHIETSVEHVPQQAKQLSFVGSESASTIKTSQWFLNGQIGGQKLNSFSSTTVNNGSGFIPPYNQDIYTSGDSDMTVLLGVQMGHRWVLSNQWLTALSLGAQYQHFFTSNVSGQVMEFSLPEYTNYNYQWKTASDLVLANGKFNFVEYHRFSPFFNVGIGAVFHNSGYSEAALPDITARISPNYHNHSDAQFAYVLGAGIDYQLSSSLIASAGYQYSNFGNLNSGYGTETWSFQKLQLGRYQSNAFLLGLTYLFDMNLNHLYQK